MRPTATLRDLRPPFGRLADLYSLLAAGHPVSKPTEETLKATYGLMCACLAIDMGWTKEEALEFVRLAFEVKQSAPPSSLPPQ